MTRCVPPLRSRPRLIGSGLEDVGMIDTVNATRIPTISATFHHKLLFTENLHQWGRELGRLGARAVPGNDAGDGRARDLDFHILGNAQVDNFALNTLDGSVNPAGG